MKIKKLELVGFKSFVDRTVLHFDHDVLGIVGPNGCGKSNIVDAIRWCMGEQSARHLRGRSMEDVIFNGSETRSAHDFAEVTLTFINDTPDDLPLEYKDYAEVAVTRRLYRTGESEYLINKTAVRLRDVTDLFLGTGAGTKAYSIVEQGKVGLIVSAKPEDRRLLIEEAAGITKFKSRKKQAEKKMELTQQNLLRVGDIVSEIERNLVSLKRQAAKAERYVSYKSELEDLQLHEASHRFLEYIGWIKLETGEVERTAAASDQIRADLTARDADLEAARLDLLAAEGQLEAAQRASFDANGAVRVEQAAIERASDRSTSLARRDQQAGGEKQEMAGHAARLVAEQESVVRDQAAFADEESSQAARLAQEDAVLVELAGVHRAADARVSERRQVVSAAQAGIASAEAKLGGFERRKRELGARYEKVTLERGSLETARVEHAANVTRLAESIDEVRAERVSAAAEKTRVEGELAALKDRILGEERALDEAKGELSKKRSRRAALEEMHARLEGVGAGTKALVGTRDACIVGLVADRIEAPADLTQALAGLLGARLEDVVVRDPERAIQLLDDLARSRKGRAAVVVQGTAFVAGACGPLPAEDGIVGRLAERLRFAAEDEALVRALVGDAVVVEDLACARRLRSAGVRAALVTVAGAVIHADGRIAGGQGDGLAAGMLDGKREARELGAEVARLDELVTARHKALQDSRADITRAGAALDRARQKAHASELAMLTAQKDLQKSEGQLESVVRRLDVIGVEEAELGRGIAEGDAERDAAAALLAETRGAMQVAQEDLLGAEAALADAREQVDRQRQVVTSSKVAIAGTRERLTAARATASRLARSATELQERTRRLEEELAANALASDETAAELVLHRRQLEEAQVLAHAADEELARDRASFEDLRGRLQEQEGALKELRARADAARNELTTHEMALREKQLAVEHLLAGVADKFRGLHLPRVVGDYHMRPPPDDVLRSRIDELARLLERMGSVNLDAMREHAEAEERFAYYSAQNDDLKKALADLDRAIQQMNRESRRLFIETFDAINARFREVFPRMFRGGRAELRMNNPDDLLETGIDIVAQPPGKKLSSIELMSGGEKALTAVSLVFSIFQIKPSPFCILDEVDAPLDEANVARYNEMVRSMTDRSQFILITHIKRTMQTVDVLYGVTMPEAGVSKIVSVKMNDRAARPAPRPEVAVA